MPLRRSKRRHRATMILWGSKTIHDSRFYDSRSPMNATFKIWRGDASGGEFREYTTEISEVMVVLDAVHDIQRTQANDLACRWNCKAGKCGSCSRSEERRVGKGCGAWWVPSP